MIAPRKYRLEFDLHADPESLWPLIADTNHFNAQMGSTAPDQVKEAQGKNARLRFRYRAGGVESEYIQEPYEWVRPFRYSVVRHHLRGPYSQTDIRFTLKPKQNSGTQLIYEADVRPRNHFGALFTRLAYGLVGMKRIKQTIAHFDQLAAAKLLPLEAPAPQSLPDPSTQRLQNARAALLAAGISVQAVDRLLALIERGDDITLSRIRPYALADYWHLPRREILEACLYATRVGLFTLQWDLLCPLCRGSKATSDSLKTLEKQVHCDVCQIDFEINFERSVELTFRPHPTVREVEAVDFCIAGPQVTPHVVVQQLIAAGQQRTLTPLLETGRYRLRTLRQTGWQAVRVTPEGQKQITLGILRTEGTDEEPLIAPDAQITLVNDSADEQLFILERTQWSDQAVVAADVTVMQTFRDLFSSEALRPGEQILVGSLTILFTDLRGSTQMYRRIGDAPAFGLVMSHFDVLKQVIADHNGALVKTMGDAVMAAFRRPADAVRATLAAQETFHHLDTTTPVVLKAGIHTGSCIAVTLNERLDYFGTTVNMASRLEGFSRGDDLILSSAVCDDPEVVAMLHDEFSLLDMESFETALKGFDNELFKLARIRRRVSLLEFV